MVYIEFGGFEYFMLSICADYIVAKKIHDLHTAFAVMVFLYFGAHFLKNIGRHDLRKHILNDFSVKAVNACVLFVFQYIINGAADERFPLIGDAPAVEFEEDIFYIHAYRWKRKYNGTLESLANGSHRPHTMHPNAQTDEEKKHIADLVRRNPNIGLNELYGKLRLYYAYKRNPVTLYRYLRRTGFYEHKRKYIPYKPMTRPNILV